MRGYIYAIGQALALFPLAAGLFTLPYLFHHRVRYGAWSSWRLPVVYSLLGYLLCAYCLVIFPLPTAAQAAALEGHPAQLIPLACVGDMLRDGVAVRTTLLNLLLTLPFGVYLRGYFRCGWGRTAAACFLLSLFFELTQLTGLYFLYPGSYRIFDVDDLLVNTAGGLAGYLLASLATRLRPGRAELAVHGLARGMG